MKRETDREKQRELGTRKKAGRGKGQSIRWERATNEKSGKRRGEGGHCVSARFRPSQDCILF